LLECLQRPSQRRHAGEIAVGEANGDAVKQQIRQSGRLPPGRSSASGSGHLLDVGRTAEAPRENDCTQRLEVGVTRGLDV
jgi:hypothetical protein